MNLKIFYDFNSVRIDWKDVVIPDQKKLKSFTLKKNDETLSLIIDKDKTFFTIDSAHTKAGESMYILIGNYENWSSWSQEISRKELEIPQIESIDLNFDYLTEIKNYIPKCQKLQERIKMEIKCANILIIGGMGTGKSSVIKTLITAIQNSSHISKITETRSTGEHVTTKYNCLDLSEEYDVKIKLFDAWGWVDEKNYEDDAISSILTGKLIPGHEMFDKILQENNNLNQNPTLNDSIHCLVLIVSLKEFDKPEYYNKFDAFRKHATFRGIPFVVLVTKCDQTGDVTHDHVIKRDATQIYNSFKLYDARNTVAKLSGVDMSDILLIKNYSQELTPRKDINSISLYVLDKILMNCNDYYKRLLLKIATHPQLEEGNK